MNKQMDTIVLQAKPYDAKKQETGRSWYMQMDGLRFIAVFAVLVEHFAYFIGHPFHLGYFGVDLFFVISGFLITEGLLIDKYQRKASSAIGKFYFRRFLRIFPIYYLLLIVALVAFQPFSQVAPWAFTYTINYYPAITGNDFVEPFGHLWSLSVEEQFYLFWPFIVLFTPNRYFLAVIGLIFTASLVYFLAEADYVGLMGRATSLTLGAFLAYMKKINPEKYKKDITKRFVMALLFAAAVYAFVDGSLGITFISFGLVYLASNNAYRGVIKRFLENKKIIYIGKISYGVYLYHLPIGYLISTYAFDPLWNKIHFGVLQPLYYNSWLIKLPLYTLITIGIAHISYSLIEKPLLKYKEKIR